jgi:hypothetical protein
MKEEEEEIKKNFCQKLRSSSLEMVVACLLEWLGVKKIAKKIMSSQEVAGYENL